MGGASAVHAEFASPVHAQNLPLLYTRYSDVHAAYSAVHAAWYCGSNEQKEIIIVMQMNVQRDVINTPPPPHPPSQANRKQ